MQWLAEICVRRPIFAMMLILALVVAGVYTYSMLGVDRFPNIDMPNVRVMTTYRGASAAEVETEVTQVLEEAVSTVAGIDELRSITSDESSLLLLTFEIDRDIDAATQDVRDAVASVLNLLPPDVDPPVIRKQDLDASPIMSIAVSGPREQRELFVLAERDVKQVIESASGVGEVLITGASDRAVQINIDAARLAAYRLSIVQVHDAVVQQNAEVPGGRVDAGFHEFSLRTLGRLPEAEQFSDLVVSTVDGVPIRIRDIGEARDYQKEARTLARFDGAPAVVLEVQRQSGANTVEVIDAVKERLARSRELLPSDVQVEVLQDQSRYIHAALHEIQNHLVSGSILATIVVLLFMRSWRSTLIAAVAIPTSIVGSFAVMWALGFTLNNVTMLALVLMVGVVIDDAIVVLENVFRTIEEKRVPPMQAAIEGTREIGLAVLATTLSLVIVFLPVSFLSSVTGKLLFEFGITAAVAVMISMLVSFSLTPMMCSRMLKLPPEKTGEADAGREPASRRGPYHWLESGYMFCLRTAMRFRWLVLLVALAVIASNVPLFSMVRQDYIPTNVDESEYEVRLYAPEGATPEAMRNVLQIVEREFLQIPGVEHVLSTVGSSVLGANNARVYVRLTDIEQRSFSFSRLWTATLAGKPGDAFAGNFDQREKMREMRRILKRFPDLRPSIRNLTSFRQGAPVDIDFVITGQDLQTLGEFAARLKDRVAEIPGVVDADMTLRFDKPNLLADIDRERAGAFGANVKEIGDTLRIAVGGDDRASRYFDSAADDAYDVELRLVGVDRDDPESISQLYVSVQPPQPQAAMQPPATHQAAIQQFASGRPQVAGLASGVRGAPLTRLDNLVHFREGYSAARIDRLDRQRMVAVRANISGGYALGDRLEEVKKAAQELGVPEGYNTHVLGRGRELDRTLSDFGWMFLLSFVFMYIVLAAQYEHLVHPLTILLSLPLAVPFGLFALWLGGETLNLYSALGILVLFGVVKKAAILQVDHMNQLRAGGMEREKAILVANRDRLRPILMTALSFVAGMIPMLIAAGPGAEERRSIAVLVVGGQSLSLLITLLAIPVIYSLLDDLGLLLRGEIRLFRRRGSAPAPATAVASGEE